MHLERVNQSRVSRGRVGQRGVGQGRIGLGGAVLWFMVFEEVKHRYGRSCSVGAVGAVGHCFIGRVGIDRPGKNVAALSLCHHTVQMMRINQVSSTVTAADVEAEEIIVYERSVGITYAVVAALYHS